MDFAANEEQDKTEAIAAMQGETGDTSVVVAVEGPQSSASNMSTETHDFPDASKSFLSETGPSNVNGNNDPNTSEPRETASEIPSVQEGQKKPSSSIDAFSEEKKGVSADAKQNPNQDEEEDNKIPRIPEDQKNLGETTGKCEKPRASMVKDDNGFQYYRCRFCGLTFNYMTTLKAHERVHDIIQPYTCNKCGEAFHFMCELEYHAKSHADQRGYRCECGRTFYQYTDLLYHKHPGEEDDAPVASSSFSEALPPVPLAKIQSSLSITEFPTPEYAVEGYEPKHPLRVWSDIRTRPYICQYCSKSYPDSRQLAYHMYSHRGERVFNPRASRYLMCRNDNSYISPGSD